jgi:uncharacterized membrane protein
MDTNRSLQVPGRSLEAGRGWSWIPAGWALFLKAPLMWVVTIVLLFVVALAMSLLPILGSLAFQVLTPVIAGGLVRACHNLENGGEFELDSLLSGFREGFGPLVLLGVIFTVVGVLILLVMAGIMGFSVMGALMGGAASEDAVAAVAGSIMAVLLGTLVALALLVPLMAAYWFAPALVAMHGMAPVEAMKASFFACMRNFIPFLVYGFVMGVIGLIAMIPFGLGMLVWLPLAITSTYVAYREIFTAEAAPPKAAALMV